jgi:poly(A) polymerase
LEAQGNQPSKNDDEFRLRVINDLEVLLNRWVTSIRPFQDKNQLSAPSNKKWARPKVCLLPFGSYRLGVHRKDADLDCLCLAPPASSRREFFTSLIKLLNDDDRVQQVHAISSAYTPVIKFLFQGLHMDLLFARLEDGTKLAHHQSLVDGRRMEYAIDDADLMGLDEASVRSLNGGRVAQTLLNIVPNVDTFRMTLRAIKEWALVHGLYSNVLGFLGGVNFAIQVAFICKRHHKDTTPAALLKAFFSTFAKWKWPMPVTVVPISYQPPQGGTFTVVT